MSALKAILDKYNVGLYEILKEIGMVKSLGKYLKLYNNPKTTITDVDTELLIALANHFNITIDEMLSENDKSGVNLKINSIRNHIDLIKMRIAKLDKGTAAAKENIAYATSGNISQLFFKREKLDQAKKLRLIDNFQEFQDLKRSKNSPMRTPDARHECPECEVDFSVLFDDLKNSPVRGHVTHGDGSDSDYSKNSLVRVYDDALDDLENSATPGANTEDSDEFDADDTGKIDVDSSTDLDDLSENSVLYHNKDYANVIFKRLRRLKKEYEKSPAGMNAKRRVIPRYNLTPIPNKFAALCATIIECGNVDENETDEAGFFNVVYSVFSNRKEFLFSEVYSCRYSVQGEDKDIKFFKRTFYDLIEPNMDFEFTDDEEISEADFYHGVYRTYRLFNFQR